MCLDKTQATTLLNGNELPSLPIFLSTSLLPNFSTARANEKTLLIDSIGTPELCFPALKTFPLTSTKDIAKCLIN